MIQRYWRNKRAWLVSMVQVNPVILNNGIANVITINAKKQEVELKDIKEKIKKYEMNNCIAEKLTEII